MKHVLYFLLACITCMVVSCSSHDDGSFDKYVTQNAENVFGIKFDPAHNWSTTINSTIKATANTSNNVCKVQLLATYYSEADSAYDVKILNEASVVPGQSVEMSYDVPVSTTGLIAAFVHNDGTYMYSMFKVGDKQVMYDKSTPDTRALGKAITKPSENATVTGTVESFANIRGWLPGEVLYDVSYQPISVQDYDEDFKTLFRTIIFNYFPNGRKYDNLPQIKKSGYYNESVYPITTGEEPIVITPVYKNDGGYHEICNADLYYYYFRGTPTVAEIEALPKYKAVKLGDIYTNNVNDKVGKTNCYVLSYFGDGIPQVGDKGTYDFPRGYKIGFMYKSNTTTDQKKKQGEVYGDGRLNYNINHFGNFASSKLEDTDPRMAWMTVNKHMFLCVESGTDKDFNDLIVEVEGGITPIEIIPDEPEYNYYTFCFEDHSLGDYDMNDVVLKARRVNETKVEYTLMACGAYDDIYINNINGSKIKSDAEVHDIMGCERHTYINTQHGSNSVSYVTDVITVNKSFSFLDVTTQPYIYDATIDNEVRIATAGQDPHAIMIPYDFKWPLERICIKDAYSQFNIWGSNKILSTDWYLNPSIDKVF